MATLTTITDAADPRVDDYRDLTAAVAAGHLLEGEDAAAALDRHRAADAAAQAELAARTEYWLGQQGRITHPMVRRPNASHYEPIEWDEAFRLVAGELNGLDSPDGATFYTSGRASNEAAFAYQLFARAFGTNNLPDCSNMCHESTSIALQESIGIGKASVTLPDLIGADLIVIGLKRQRGAVGLLLGSRVDALIRSSAVPVLGVPTEVD